MTARDINSQLGFADVPLLPCHQLTIAQMQNMCGSMLQANRHHFCTASKNKVPRRVLQSHWGLCLRSSVPMATLYIDSIVQSCQHICKWFFLCSTYLLLATVKGQGLLGQYWETIAAVSAWRIASSPMWSPLSLYLERGMKPKTEF